MRPALLLLVVVVVLAGCGGGDRASDGAGETAAAAAAPTSPAGSDATVADFDVDDPAYSTIPASDGARRALIRRSGSRADFRVPRELVLRVPDGPLVLAVVARMFDELDPSDIPEALSAGQRAVYELYYADYEILNGGFAQLWGNTSGAFAGELAAAARRVGSPELEAIYRDAQALWPGGRIPRGREARVAALDTLPGNALAALDDRYARTQYRRRTAQAFVLGGYVRRHLGEFVAG